MFQATLKCSGSLVDRARAGDRASVAAVSDLLVKGVETGAVEAKDVLGYELHGIQAISPTAEAYLNSL